MPPRPRLAPAPPSTSSPELDLNDSPGSRAARRLLAIATAACAILTHATDAGAQPSHADHALSLGTDKARYAPGEPVVLTLGARAPAGARIRYLHLDSIVADAPIVGTTWSWTPPARDFAGYLAEVYRSIHGGTRVLATTGIDVSSSWTRFPRYGFLSSYPAMSGREMRSVIARLNRYHIDGLQFYDWQHEHHEPLAGSVRHPTPVYRDIGGRYNHLATIRGYIEAAHARNMSAMFYNLVYGAWTGAEADGVAPQWYLYTDARHTHRDAFRLAKPPFLSDIEFLDPANPGWERYIAARNRDVYAALPFDGYHMDQVGERPAREYTWGGTPLDLASRFGPFIGAMKANEPRRYHVMNAVNQYGQPGIAKAPTDFLYTEVWGPHDSFASLADILRENDSLSAGTKSSVLAAYVNHARAGRPGYFNTPAVLYTDAVIFAFGGDHIELGEHMLGREYFPNHNLRMRGELAAALPHYYDFLVAYENLLRDGGGSALGTPALSSRGGTPVVPWPARLGAVAVAGKTVGNQEVLHLLNFAGATTLQWRDDRGTQHAPRLLSPLPLQLSTERAVRRIWVASPDANGGAPSDLAFDQRGGKVTFTIPSLRYWDMVVVEYADR